MARFCKINHQNLASSIVTQTLSLPKTVIEKKCRAMQYSTRSNINWATKKKSLFLSSYPCFNQSCGSGFSQRQNSDPVFF